VVPKGTVIVDFTFNNLPEWGEKRLKRRENEAYLTKLSRRFYSNFSLTFR
jgi:hypothetical protein